MTAGEELHTRDLAQRLCEAEATIEALLSGQAFRKGEDSRFMTDLVEATRMLAAPDEIMTVMSRMLGGHLCASRCAYADVDTDGDQFTILHDYTDGCPSTVGHYHLSLFGPRAVATLHSGQTLIVRSVEAELAPGEGADMFNAIGVEAIITCPLVKGGTLRAMMAVHQTTPRDWTSREVAVVQEVVERCWATIERRRAEATLRERTAQLVESEARFRQITEAIREVFFLTDPSLTRVFYVSPAYEQVFGRSCESLYVNAQSWAEAVHPDDRERTLAAIVPGGTVVPFDVEFRILRPDGGERSLWARGYPIYTAAGEIDRFAGITEDITERKRAAEEVRASEERFQVLEQNSWDSVHLLSAEGIILWESPSVTRVLGYHPEELVGRNSFELIHPDDVAMASERFAPIASTPGLTLTAELRVRHKNGSWPWMDCIATNLLDHPAVRAIAINYRDITDRRMAEAAQAQREAELQESQRIARIGSWEWTPATGAVTWSEGMNHVLGRTHALAAPTFEALPQFYTPDSWQQLGHVMARAVETGASYNLELDMIGADGVIRRTITRGEAMCGADGTVMKLRGTVHDITEHHKLEAQFQQAQKMEAIGRLAGGVAHDFNNLLTVILGFCELTMADLALDDRRRADIAEIEKAGRSAAKLTRQLLAFSRKEIIEPTLLDLNAIIADVRPMLGRLIREDVKVLLGLRPGLAVIKADRGQVVQVLLNLAVNAQDAMLNGGTLTIETANVELDEQYGSAHLGVRPGSYVSLTVSDTGTGMTPEVQARLFEPFFTTKEVGTGTGLGLATVHGIVARSGGSVSVYSEVDRGTSFKVYFPQVDVSHVVGDAPPPAVRAPTGTETILVVEDADGLRELAKRLLERQGYTVLVAANADDALKLFEQNASIDVLLTDVVMPGASGPELALQLVNRRPTLKVVYMSGYTEDAIVQHGVLKPGISFLHKPFTSDALGRKIRGVLDGQTPPKADA
jgi:two-component system cell cycle sensor histidine kinase/response regulator CckA